MKIPRLISGLFFKVLWSVLFLILLGRLVPVAKELNPFRLAQGMSTSAELLQIEEAVKQYHLNNDRYPENFSQFLDQSFESKLKNVAVDSWGTPYRFNCQGRANYEIRSAGPDKVFGNSDDFVIRHEGQDYSVSRLNGDLPWVLA